MSYRYMRVLVFFDLPTETTADKRAYRLFRKALIRNGFVMLQQSVYCRLLINTNAGKAAMETVRKNKPPEGLVQMLTITEKQFADIEYLVGRNRSDVISTDERVIIL
jgi:CRISPR-associated protein Cas2